MFFNIGDDSNVNGSSFDQNRVALQFGYRFNKHLDAELGYRINIAKAVTRYLRITISYRDQPTFVSNTYL